jgi:hypothetical protein
VKVRDEANIGFTTLASDRSASGLQQLNLHACSFTSRYKMHRGHIFTIEALRVPERGDQTKDHNIRKLLALIIALDLTPNSVGQIDNDWFGSAPHDDPLQGKSIRRNDFLVGKPRRNIEEIARVQGGIEPPVLPPEVGRAAQHVRRDRVLLTVMVRAAGSTRKTPPHMGESMPASR